MRSRVLPPRKHNQSPKVWWGWRLIIGTYGLAIIAGLAAPNLRPGLKALVVVSAIVAIWVAVTFGRVR